MKKNIPITYFEKEIYFYEKDMEVVVGFDYIPTSGDNWNEPRIEEYIEICSTKVDGIEIDFNQDDLYKIEGYIWATEFTSCFEEEEPEYERE